MEKYTEKIHAERVKEMLKIGDPCSHCPAAIGFSSYRSSDEQWDDDPFPCNICARFVGILDYINCPCLYYGNEKAVSITIEQLILKGYLTKEEVIYIEKAIQV